MIFLAGRDRYTQRTLLHDVHDRLTRQAGCEDVRYRPSRRRPRYVIADVDPTTFLSDSYNAETARLEIRFWYPAGVDHEYYRINWVEPERNLMLGFHQDADHPERVSMRPDCRCSNARRRSDFRLRQPSSLFATRLVQIGSRESRWVDARRYSCRFRLFGRPPSSLSDVCWNIEL